MITEEISLMNKLGDYVKFKRLKKGYTQESLADRMQLKGINGNYISKIERKDLQGMNISTLETLLSALDSDITFLERDN